MLWNLGTGDVQVSTPEEVVETWRQVMSHRERKIVKKAASFYSTTSMLTL